MSRPLKDLHLLPKVRDSLSYLYIERGKIDRDAKAIAVHDERGKTAVPCAAITTLMLGPGTTITHAAIQTLADNGCLVVWTGEEGVRFYAQGMGETRSSQRLLRQSWLANDPQRRLAVVVRMYRARFRGDAEPMDATATIEQLRGREGVRVRDAYAQASRETGVPWQGRSYRRDDWGAADPINRALSCANACLYGICQAAIVSGGYSPALGFIHTGKMLSFVYDIADLYKADLTIPVAFRTVADGTDDLERRVRYRCRDIFHESRLLQRMLPDIDRVLNIGEADTDSDVREMDVDAALPSGLWDPVHGTVEGGVNRADDADEDVEVDDDRPDA